MTAFVETQNTNPSANPYEDVLLAHEDIEQISARAEEIIDTLENIDGVDSSDHTTFVPEIEELMSPQECYAYQLAWTKVNTAATLGEDAHIPNSLKLVRNEGESEREHEIRQSVYLAKTRQLLEGYMIANRNLHVEMYPDAAVDDQPAVAHAFYTPVDVAVAPFDWGLDEQDAAALGDVRLSERDTQVREPQQEGVDEPKAKGRFSKVFGGAKKAFAVSDGRWDAQPTEPNVQAFDATDTWQDPYEKFFGKAQPVVEYTAVPNIKKRAEKPEATDADDENDSDDTEKQTRRQRIAAKVAGTWAAGSEAVREGAGVTAAESRAQLHNIDMRLKESVSKELVKIEKEKAAAESESSSYAPYRARRSQRIGDRLQAIQRASDKVRTPETKKLLKKAAAASAAGLVAVAATKLRRK